MNGIDPGRSWHGLPDPRDYFPLESGRYEVAAGLKILGQQPVLGHIEDHHFTLDGLVPQHLLARQHVMRTAPERYHPPGLLEPEIARAIATWMIDRLASEHPGTFRTSWHGPGRATLEHDGLGWNVDLDLDADRVVGVEQAEAGWSRLLEAHPDDRMRRWGADTLESLSVRDLEGLTCLDALARFVAEDLAIIRRDPATGRDWLAWIHLAFPNHWSPAEKVGRSFLAVHEPVADFERVARTADRMLEALVHRGPFVRFAWGVATDTVLDHHPDSPPGRALSDPSPEAAIAGTWLRIERQTLRGFPEHEAALFTIRTRFTPVTQVARDPARAGLLVAALESMSEAAIAYKGLGNIREPLVAGLRAAGATLPA